MMELGLFQQQRLNLVMTAELRQAIAILQFPGYELSSYLHEKAVENPLIEVVEPRGMTTRPVKRNATKGSSEHKGFKDKALEHYTQAKMTLQDHINGQIILLDLNAEERKLMRFLIHSLDDNGYLTVSASEASERFRLPEEMAERLVKKLQQLEPAGIGARSVQECLLLQLETRGLKDSLAWILVNNHLDDLASRKIKQVAAYLRAAPEEVEKALDFIQTLNPRPGQMLVSAVGPAHFLYPDLSVYEEWAKLHVTFNDQYSPDIQINGEYATFVKNDSFPAASYMQDCYQMYQWLKRAIEQRKATLLQIMKEVASVQENYFRYQSPLVPMTLKDIAERTGFHESTISRAIRNKSVQTSKGAVELKSFFTAKIETSDGGNASASEAKSAIAALISSENKAKPLSDQQICEDLKKKNGLSISRRTVAKYREELHILSSSKRKRFST